MDKDKKKQSASPKKVKNPVLEDILKELEKEKKDRVAFPYWGNWVNWGNWGNWGNWANWRNWGNWYNGW
jgi:hypothetical protein